LNTVIRGFATAPLSMLTGRVTAPIKSTFVRITTITLQEKFQILTSADAAN
jgi:hypothetical protein